MEDQLIALVRESVFLYSKTDKRYKNTYLREKKWMEISVILGVEVAVVKKRWKSLRDKFHVELKKRTSCSGSGQPEPTTQWRYFDHMTFLRDASEERSTVTNFPTTSTQLFYSDDEDIPGLIITELEEIPGRSSPPRSAPGRSSPCRNIPGGSSPPRSAPGRSSPCRNIPGGSSPPRSAPGRSSPCRNIPGGSSPPRSTPGRSSPCRNMPGRRSSVIDMSGRSTAARRAPVWSTSARSTPDRNSPLVDITGRSTSARSTPDRNLHGASTSRGYRDDAILRAIEDAGRSFDGLIHTANRNITQQEAISSIRSFFASMADELEENQVPSHILREIKQKLMTIVHGTIANLKNP